MRRSPRLSRASTNNDSLLSVESNKSRTKKSRKSITKSGGNRRDTFVGGAEAIEQMLVDVEEEDTVNRTKETNERRQTADAGDIEKIMKELEEEDAHTKNILGHRALSTSHSHVDEGSSHQGIDCSPCPGSRESVDTVVLMNSVAALLEKVEGDGASSTAKMNLEFSDEKVKSPVATNSKATGSPSPLLNMSTGGASTSKQQSWQDLSVDDYTLNGGSFQSEDDSRYDDLSDDGTVNTVDLLSSVRNLVKNAEGEVKESKSPQISSSYQEVSIQSDLSDGTSFLSHDERRDSFDDHTVSTMGSLRSFLMDDNAEKLDTSTVSSNSTTRSPGRSKTADSLQALNKPADDVVGGSYQSPPSMANTSTVSIQGLKSCLSSRKKPRNKRTSLSSVTDSAKKRGVVFGSPKAAEFNKTSPVTSYTPMHNHEAKSRFSMAGNSVYDEQEEDDELTTENSAILDEWDRLTNTSMDGSGSDEDSGSPDESSSGSKVMQRGNGRRATISGSSTDKVSVASPSRSKKRRQSVQAALPVLQNSASLKKNRRRKSRLHISDSDLQPSSIVDDDSSSCMDMSGMDTSGEVSRTENLPGNLEELMQQPDLNPSPGASTCSSIESSAAPPLNSLVRSAALNASMSMASLNDSMTDRTQTLEQDLNALMSRVEKSDNNVSTYYNDNQSSPEDESRRLSQSSVQSSVAGEGLGSLLNGEDREMTSFESDPSDDRMQQIANVTSPTSSSDNSMASNDQSQDQEVTVDSVISFKKRSRRSLGSISANSSVEKRKSRRSLDESNVSASQEFTQELEMNLDTMMQTVIKDAVKQPSTMDETGDDISLLTTSVMQPDQSYMQDDSEDDVETVLDEDAQLIDDAEEESVVAFGRSRASRGKSLIGQGECDISVISKSLESVDDSTSTVPEHEALQMSSSSLNLTGVSASGGETPNMLRKLRGLNAVSRRQSLTHAAHTPLAAAGRMSIGMKRMSLASQQLESTTKRMTQRYEQRFTDTASTQVASSDPSEQHVGDTSVVSVASSAVSNVLNVSHGNTESYRDNMLQQFLTQLNLKEAFVTEERTETLFDMLTKFSDSYTLEKSNMPLMDPSNRENFRSEVQSIFREVLSAATEETTENATLMKGDMINLWHCMDESRYSTLVEALESENTETSSPLDELSSMATRNVAISARKWQSWEVDLMQVAMEAITAKKLNLREENLELERELQESSEESETKNDDVSVEALQKQLAEMQSHMSELRKEVSKKSEHLQEVQQQCSNALTEKKNYLVSLASQPMDVEADSDVNESNDSTAVASAEEISSSEKQLLDDTKDAVDEMKFRINILNKMTYCRIMTYKSNQIKTRVQLTKSTHFDLVFDLKLKVIASAKPSGKNHRSVKSTASTEVKSLCIDKVSVLPSFDPAASLDSFHNSETMLAVAFYLNFLSSDSHNGPVSAKRLSSFQDVKEISKCLQQVSGYVSSLRDVMTWLGHMHLSPEFGQSSGQSASQTKWMWGINESEEKDFIVHLVHSSDVRVDIPLAALVSGDMEFLPNQFREQITPQSPGAVSVQKKLSQLADRCSSPFGSFPIGQIMHAIAPN